MQSRGSNASQTGESRPDPTPFVVDKHGENGDGWDGNLENGGAGASLPRPHPAPRFAPVNHGMHHWLQNRSDASHRGTGALWRLSNGSIFSQRTNTLDFHNWHRFVVHDWWCTESKQDWTVELMPGVKGYWTPTRQILWRWTSSHRERVSLRRFLGR